MDNSENSNCCTPNQESSNNTDCCIPAKSNSNKGLKNKFGLGVLGLALILALTTAFKSSKEVAVISCDTTESSVILSIIDFEWLKTDKKVAYIVLKGEDTNQNEKISVKVEGIVNELNGTDGSAYFLALEANNVNYEDVVSKLKVKKIPAIAVIGKGTSVINAKDISLAKLIRAYDAALSATSCSPAKKASCKGKAKASCNTKTKTSCTTAEKASCVGSKKSN